MARYTARVYFDDEKVTEQQGDDLDALHSWMLASTQGKFGNFNGEITDNKTGEVVKSFRKSPPD